MEAINALLPYRYAIRVISGMQPNSTADATAKNSPLRNGFPDPEGWFEAGEFELLWLMMIISVGVKTMPLNRSRQIR